MKTAEELFLEKYGNKITASESWVIRFAEEYASQLSPSKGVEVPTESKIWDKIEEILDVEIHPDDEGKGNAVSQIHDFMLSLLSEKDKNIEEWKENFNTSIKLWEEERKKFQSELEAVKKENEMVKCECGKDAHVKYSICDEDGNWNCPSCIQEMANELKSHADKMASGFTEWVYDKYVLIDVYNSKWMSVEDFESKKDSATLYNTEELLSSYKTNLK